MLNRPRTVVGFRTSDTAAPWFCLESPRCVIGIRALEDVHVGNSCGQGVSVAQSSLPGMRILVLSERFCYPRCGMLHNPCEQHGVTDDNAVLLAGWDTERVKP